MLSLKPLRVVAAALVTMVMTTHASCMGTSRANETVWTGRTFIEGLKRIDDGKVEVVYAIEVRNAGRTRPSNVRIGVRSGSGSPHTVELKNSQDT